MGSTGLPGKVLLKTEKNKTVLDFVVEQLRNCKNINKIVIATTNLSKDDSIVNASKSLNIEYFRCDTNDVIGRYYECAKKFSFSTIVRIIFDCPIIDPEFVDKSIENNGIQIKL